MDGQNLIILSQKICQNMTIKIRKSFNVSKQIREICVLQLPKIWKLKKQHLNANIVNESDSKRTERQVFL